jgi:hypothetical protein
VIDLHAVMSALSMSRPIFHSEADFQHALAMQVAHLCPTAEIRLECRPVPHERAYLDLWVDDGNQRLAIELKYKTRSADVELKGERFDLANHGAQDIGAYDVWKDVHRVERVCAQRPGVQGCVIFLSNDAGYWRKSGREGTIASAFRLHEGRTASGILAWATHAGAGTTKNREAPIVLRGSYRIHWHDYSKMGPDPRLTLRYTIIPVSAAGPEETPVDASTERAPDTVIAPTDTVPLRAVSPQRSMSRRRSKYSPLHDYLKAQKVDRVDLSFSGIEQIIGSSLPRSARAHAAFWANDDAGSHLWAMQWMAAGWKVESYSFSSERVVFTRVGVPRA